MYISAHILTLILILAMEPTQNADSLYDFKLKMIDGKEVSMSDFEGRVLLIVNTASECGFTPQYDGLQSLHERYQDKNFSVLGFPANNFGGQEPGEDEEIAEFCRVRFGVEFPLFSKLSVRGKDIHPFFDYLTSLEESDITGPIEWNFEKFLIGAGGQLAARFRSGVEPESEEMIEAIERELAAAGVR